MKVLIMMILFFQVGSSLANGKESKVSLFTGLLPTMKSFVRVGNPVVESPEVAARKKRHKICMEALEKYFMSDVSHEAMKKFLLAQYEITSAKAFSLMLMIRLNERASYMRKDSPFLPSQDYLTLVKSKMSSMQLEMRKDPEFAKAYSSFLRAPLTVDTFAKVAPYLEKYAKMKGMYGSEVASHLHFDDNDLKMLDILISMEKNSPDKKKINLVPFMQWANIDKMGSMRNSQATIEMSVAALIKPNKEYIKDFLDGLRPPKECKDERRDILIGEMQCQDCYDFSKDSIYTLVESSDEIAQLLFDSALKRKDLKNVRDRKFHWKLFYFGKGSPWGTLDDSLGIMTPDIRLDPEEH